MVNTRIPNVNNDISKMQDSGNCKTVPLNVTLRRMEDGESSISDTILNFTPSPNAAYWVQFQTVSEYIH
jgi:hypothetical protein